MRKTLCILILLLVFANFAFGQQIAQIQQRYELLNWVNVKESRHGAKGDGTTDDSVAFISACAAAINKILYVPPGTYKLSNNVTAGATVEVWFSNGVTLSVDNTKTFTISGKLTSPHIPTNSGAGTFTYSGSARPAINGEVALSTPVTLNAVGIKMPFIAASTMAFGDVCYLNSSGKMAFVDADAVATCVPIAMCADASISADASGNFLLWGVATLSGWSWTGYNKLLYPTVTATTGNTLSETAPSGTDDVIAPCAVSLSATTVLFIPQFITIERN